MAESNREKIVTFRPDPDVYAAMVKLRDTVGVPFAVQIRQALRVWLKIKPAKKRR